MSPGPVSNSCIQTTSLAMMWKICNYNGKCTMLINLMPRKNALTWTYEGPLSQIVICLLGEEENVLLV